ncbi:MAG TPA: hypothetical protein VJZ91_17715, partial [Blastocatellia bacterium]|nr:hypothetical protein [Blastocatellia bacterium]
KAAISLSADRRAAVRGVHHCPLLRHRTRRPERCCVIEEEFSAAAEGGHTIQPREPQRLRVMRRE